MKIPLSDLEDVLHKLRYLYRLRLHYRILGDRLPETQEGKLRMFKFSGLKSGQCCMRNMSCVFVRELVKQHLTKKQSGHAKKTDCIKEEFA